MSGPAAGTALSASRTTRCAGSSRPSSTRAMATRRSRGTPVCCGGVPEGERESSAAHVDVEVRGRPAAPPSLALLLHAPTSSATATALATVPITVPITLPITVIARFAQCSPRLDVMKRLTLAAAVPARPSHERPMIRTVRVCGTSSSVATTREVDRERARVIKIAAVYECREGACACPSERSCAQRRTSFVGTVDRRCTSPSRRFRRRRPRSRRRSASPTTSRRSSRRRARLR